MPSLRLLALGFVLACLGVSLRPAPADDDLPNFNAPVDNTPLNVDKVNHALGLDPSLWTRTRPRWRSGSAGPRKAAPPRSPATGFTPR
ncbi:MAG: hypothetical protein WDO13_17440 [Verrucomicrobiota bacterium]